MKKGTGLFIANVVVFLAVLIVNYTMAVGQNIGGISGEINYLFKPAPYAFSIWGLIYLLLAVWIIRAFFTTGEERDVYQKIGLWFPLNLLLNALWVIVFGKGHIVLSVFVIIALLLTLIVIYSIIQNSGVRKILLRTPISIYLGWVSVATIVNIFTVLTYKNVESLLGLDQLTWTLIMLVVGGLLAIYFTFKNKDIAYPLVVIWAYIAIIVEQKDMPSIVVTAWITVAAIAVAILIECIRKIKR
ncbi:TspO/MBR family protein [Priestia koreensis]|uniref:TspO/MBR family protein n=1 Tax=Priestia koreensis TaxID=284581 RepID=UPI00203CEC40|nr:TspO/MBR family protein [Priestia koreensis]MCM3005281.1 tryptophan-rich sensory protein [Priestia koreensis]